MSNDQPPRDTRPTKAAHDAAATSTPEGTRLLPGLSLEQLLEAVYPQLRALAGHLMRNEREEHTLQPTALVHEAVLRLLEQDAVAYANPRHLIAIAASAMRRALVDHARRRRSTKRDGGVRVPLSDDLPATTSDFDLDLIAVDHALQKLATMDSRQARIVELRYYAGLDIDETAAALDISPATVKRDWVHAKAWLQREIGL